MGASQISETLDSRSRMLVWSRIGGVTESAEGSRLLSG